MRKLLIAFSLLPIGMAPWPSSAPALECDQAIAGGPCRGSDDTYRRVERSASGALVSSSRMLVNEPIERDDAGGPSSVRLERTRNPTSARDIPPSGISLALGDESSYRQGRLGIYRAAGPLRPSGNGLQMARAEAAMPEDYSADRVAQTRHSRPQPDAGVKDVGGDKVSAVSSSMNPAPQPGSAVLMIAGLLGIYAVGRRRISSILG